MIKYIQQFIGKRAIRDVSWVTFGSLTNGLCLFLVNSILGRILTAEKFGIFALSILVLSTVAELSDFGLNAGLLRFAPYYLSRQEDGKFKQLVKTIWQWRLTLTFVLTIGGIVTAPWLAQYAFGQPALVPQLMFAYLGVGGVIMLGFITTYLQAVQRFRYQALLQSLKGALRLLLVVIMWWSGHTGLLWLLSAYVGVPWVLCVLGFFALPPGFTRVQVPAQIKRELHGQLRSFSSWLVLWSLMSIVAARVDQAMISSLLGLAGVATYTVAYQFIQFFPVLTQSIASVLTPRINGLHTKAEITNFIFHSLRWLVPLTLVVALAVYPSRWLIILFFGQKYASAMPVYLVLAYSITLNILATAFTIAITAFNQTKLMALSGAVQLGVNVLANTLLIPRFGVMGAAYAFALGIVTAVTYNAVCVYFLVKRGELKIV